MVKPAWYFFLLIDFLFGCPGANADGLPGFTDTAYLQGYSIRYMVGGGKNTGRLVLKKVAMDRNGVVQVASSEGILKTAGGQLLYPGQLVPDVAYLPLVSKKINNLGLYQNQFVYADDKAILSNAWAGTLYCQHTIPDAMLFSGGEDFSFVISNGSSAQFIKDSKVLSEWKTDEQLRDVQYDKKRNLFWLLTEHSIAVFNPVSKMVYPKFQGNDFTCFALAANEVVVGTHDGYFKLNALTGKKSAETYNALPCRDITVIKEIGHQLWFGSVNGAFLLRQDGKFNYYASKRWIPSNNVVDIAEGSNHTLLILTDKGLGEIHFDKMTLFDKAMYYERQVRARHIRLGFNATITRMKNGDVNTGSLEDSDNDGLWTSMYLGAEVFRYAATKSPEALQNCRESLDAMENLYIKTSLRGFPARSFERRGFEVSDTKEWQPAENPEWDWKTTTSSDEAIGHMFVFGAIAELIDVPEIKNKAIRLMDGLMSHIVAHEMYMIDWDGKPTRWGRWNPEYVNAMPKNVGDRKITSSNIISMLQTAYHFTGKKIFKEKALELMNKYGYLENLMRPMKEIGHAPDTAMALAKDLSDNWNHSDDEMYFLGYWGLYRYALNDKLKASFKTAILDHWLIERPEKDAAWNIFTAMTGVSEFDRNEAIWYLQKYPLDLVEWKVTNSGRNDIRFIAKNFRNQTIEEVLPPDELPINRHNSNRFDLDGGSEDGNAEYSAGDIWLLPYWMGRYLKVIDGPVNSAKATAPMNKGVGQ